MEEYSIRPKVMIVDDAEDNLMIMDSILAKEYSIAVFTKAKNAIEYAIGNPPDLILLDVVMPEIDGFETCRRLKENVRLTDVPIIFITSKNESEFEEIGFSVGASDFIQKPINSVILQARVKTHLKIKFAINFLKNENARLKSGAIQASTQLEQVTKMLLGGQNG